MPQKEQKRIIDKLSQIAETDKPRECGKCLTGKMKEFWRYRIGDYRVICDIRDKEILILVIEIGHRREIYNQFKRGD